jgi:hypothetical protein
MDCYHMYPDRTWIVISCVPTVHGLLSHVSRTNMDCYLMYPDRTWHEITIHVWSRYMRKQSTYGQDTWDNNSCTVGIHEITHVSRPYMDCYLVYPDRTWIVISCILTVHGLLSHVSRPYMDCYLMYPDRTWIVISCILTCTVGIHEITIHVRSGYMR